MDSSAGHESSRLARIREIARECVARRARGEALPDAQIASSHPDLMPDLELELRRLSVIARAMASVEPTADSRSPTEQAAAGDRFPDYALLSEIQRGGQGVVYRAIHRATGREVALKVLARGALAGERDRLRMRREAQILAALRHRNIVSIRDSGAAGDSDFLVTELIEGRRLDEFAAAVRSAVSSNWAQLTPRAAAPAVCRLLRVLAKVCRAVHAAHLLGIVHRDLKPANILVDDADEPHVLDFGLARVNRPEDSLAPPELTQTGQFVGSLPWASPEQAAGRLDAIEARSDVYSLGVVLYGALTGRFPYSVQGSTHEVVRNILEAEPIAPRRACRAIDSSLQCIVLACLRKRPSERYASAGELADDIERHLADEPLRARPESVWRGLRRLARRHRTAVGVSAAATVLLAAWAASFVAQANSVARARDAARGVSAFLDAVLSSGDPLEEGGGRSGYTVREMLDDASARAANELSDYPEVGASVHETLGVAYTNLGAFEPAQEHLRRAMRLRSELFGELSLEVARTHHDLAELYQSTGERDRAIESCRRAIELWRRDDGGDASALPRSLTLLAALERECGELVAAERTARQALQLLDAESVPDPRLRARCLNTLGSALRASGKLDEAEARYRAALSIRRATVGNSHPDVASSLSNLAAVALARGDPATAESLYREALGVVREALGDGNPAYTARILSGLANALDARGDAAAAERAFAEALDALRSTESASDLDRAGVLTNYGLLLSRQRRWDEAEAALNEAVSVYRRENTASVALASALENLGGVSLARGDRDDAGARFQEALELRRAHLPVDHPDIAQALMKLAAARRVAGTALAEMYREALSIRRAAFGPGDDRTLSTLESLARCLRENDPGDGAVQAFRELAEARRTALGAGDPATIDAQLNLAVLLRDAGEFDEAESLLRDALDSQRRLPGDNRRACALTLNSLAKVLMSRGDAEQAESLLGEAESLLGEAESLLSQSGADAWLVAAVQSARGACLVKLERFESAEALLASAYETLASQRGRTHELTLGAIERLVELYESSGRPEQAALWRDRLDNAP